MKTSVVQRLRQGEQWCRQHGPAYEWMATLLGDALQELESESGALWCQWSTRPCGHVRMFVAGEFGLRELDSFLELLNLQRSHMAEWASSSSSNQPSPVALADDVSGVTDVQASPDAVVSRGQESERRTVGH